MGAVFALGPILGMALQAARPGDCAQETRAPLPAEAPIESERRRPGYQRDYPDEIIQVNPGAVEVPPPEAFPVDQIPVSDRWRLIETLGVHSRWFDPYHQNTLKGDRPLPGTQDWFVALSGVSDTVIEPRSFPVPVGVQTTARPGSLDTIGRSTSFGASQTFVGGVALIKGATSFKPPDIEIRLTLAFNANYAQVAERRILSVSPSKRPRRYDSFLGLQEAFVDKHLRNVSDRYDFDALRVGIQPFTTDFRGFLFQDNALGLRLFGTRNNNRLQYNLALFRRIEKDTNSGLNDVGLRLRDDTVIAANLYRQDTPVPGMTSQLTLVYNQNREKGRIYVDNNGFPARPALIGDLRSRDYDVLYLGYNADGHLGRLNLTGSAYWATGEDRNNTFTGRPAKIGAAFIAVEPSLDLDWARVRASALYASGDKNPFDNRETGFDAILENPQFAGADTSYWIRQSIPFVGGGRAVAVNGRNGVLVDLRSSKDEGQSNFNNPGTVLAGVGADLDLMPTVRVSLNANHLWMAQTAVVEVLRQQGSISRSLGSDYSAAVIWRPRMIQNLVFRGSAAVFDPGAGFRGLFVARNRDQRFYSVLFNVILTY
jgi:hypothetical protein